MKSILSLFTLSAISSNADFKSYDASNCAYVYDTNREAAYPLDVCMTDYVSGSYISRQYTCTAATSIDGTPDIELYTYYGETCDGDADESRSALGDDNMAYRCGDGESESYDSCYLEYKEYDVSGQTECAEWESSSYTTKYVIAGVCVPIPSGNNVYSRCDSENVLQFVLFNDDQCCDLSYSYASSAAPQWGDYNIQPGCDATNGIYIDGWTCMMNEEALSADVYTDNTDPECLGNANYFILNGVVMIVFVALFSIF